MQKKGVAGNVEWEPEHDVDRSLVPHEVYFPVEYGDLVDKMTWWKGHLVHHGWVPGTDNHASIVWVCFEFFDHVFELVYALVAVVGVPVLVRSVKVSPLESVNWTEVSLVHHALFGCLIVAVWCFFWIGPFVPDMVFSVLEPLFVGDSFNKKFELTGNNAEGHFFCSEERESIAHIVSEHLSGDSNGSGAGAVFFFYAIIENVLYDIEICFHIFVLKTRGYCSIGFWARQVGLKFSSTAKTSFAASTVGEFVYLFEGGDGYGEEDGLGNFLVVFDGDGFVAKIDELGVVFAAKASIVDAAHGMDAILFW